MHHAVLYGSLFRLGTALFGFVAMWSLWRARDLRGSTWTSKMGDIWLAHMLFTVSTVGANIELFYRHVLPTGSSFILLFVYAWTIKGTFNGEFYTKSDEDDK